MTPIIDAGDLIAELLLQKPASGEDLAYDDVETVWANIRAASGSEALRFGATVSAAVYVVTIYFRSDLQASWRLSNQAVSPTRSFQILTFSDPDGERDYLQLFCVEVQ